MNHFKRPCPAGGHGDEDNDGSRVSLLSDDVLFMLYLSEVLSLT